MLFVNVLVFWCFRSCLKIAWHYKNLGIDDTIHFNHSYVLHSKTVNLDHVKWKKWWIISELSCLWMWIWTTVFDISKISGINCHSLSCIFLWNVEMMERVTERTILLCICQLPGALRRPFSASWNTMQTSMLRWFWFLYFQLIQFFSNFVYLIGVFAFICYLKMIFSE